MSQILYSMPLMIIACMPKYFFIILSTCGATFMELRTCTPRSFCCTAFHRALLFTVMVIHKFEIPKWNILHLCHSSVHLPSWLRSPCNSWWPSAFANDIYPSLNINKVDYLCTIIVLFINSISLGVYCVQFGCYFFSHEYSMTRMNI